MLIVSSNAIELELATGVNNDGHLKTDLIDCTVIARNVALNFTPADIEVLRNYIPHIVHFVMQRMDQVIERLQEIGSNITDSGTVSILQIRVGSGDLESIAEHADVGRPVRSFLH